MKRLPPIDPPGPEKMIAILLESNSFLIRTAVKETDDWNRARTRVMCASEVAAFLGVDRDCSRKKALFRKSIGYKEDFSAFVLNMFQWGKVMEPVGREKASQFLGIPVVQIGSLQHCRYPILQGEPDGVAAFEGHLLPIEIKTRCYPNPQEAVPYQSAYDIPMKHWVQVQVYAELLDAEWGLLVNVSVNNGCPMFWIPRDRHFFHQFVVPIMACFAQGNLCARLRSGEKQEIAEYINESLGDIIPCQ